MMQRRFVRLAILLFAFMGSLVSTPNLAYASSDLADEWKLVRGKKFNCQRNGQIYIYNNKLSPLYTHNQALIEAGAEKFAPKFIDQCPSMESHGLRLVGPNEYRVCAALEIQWVDDAVKPSAGERANEKSR